MKVKGWVLALFFVVCCSCEKSGDFGLGLDIPFFDTAVLDTFQVHATTYAVDSIVTLGRNRLLAGQTSNADFGDFESVAYFKLGIGDPLYFGGTVQQYDSAFLVLYLDDYDFQTADKPITFELYEINDDYSSDNSYFDFTELQLMPSPLASFSINPEEALDSVVVNMNDLGERFFDFVQEQVSVSETDDFLEDFEGLAIRLKEGEGIVGFKSGVSTQSPFLRMYYHQEQEYVESIFYDFPQARADMAYDHFSFDRSQTPFHQLAPDSPLASSENGGFSLIQGGAVAGVELVLPTVNKLYEYGKTHVVNAAILKIEAFQNSYFQKEELPDSLALYIIGPDAVMDEAIFGSSGGIQSVQYAKLNYDDEFNEYAYYEFSFLEYTLAESRTYTGSDLRIVMALPATTLANDLRGVKLADSRSELPGISLKVYLTKLIN